MTATKPKFKKQVIKVYCVQTQDKTLEVEAQVLGDYAVNNTANPHEIALTHIPSGMAIWTFHLATTCGVCTKAELRKQVRAAAVLCAALPEVKLPDMSDKKAWRRVTFCSPGERLFREQERREFSDEKAIQQR